MRHYRASGNLQREVKKMDEQLTTSEADHSIATPEEKMLPQSEVNRIVGRAKEEAALKGRRAAEAEYNQRMSAVPQVPGGIPQSPVQQPTPQQVGGVLQQQHVRNESVPREADNAALIEQIKSQLYEENARAQEENARAQSEIEQAEMKAQVDHASKTHDQQMKRGPSKYEDFSEVMKDFDPYEFAQLTYLTAGLPNGEEILYDLRKNPSKLTTLHSLAQTSPTMARTELAKLSSSIAGNQEAKANASGQQVNAPLDRLAPSRVSSGGNGKMSISDLRNQPWLKG